METGGIHQFITEHLHGLKLLIDAVAGVIAIGTITQALPHVAALFTVLWLGIRIWESDTVRGLTNRTLTGKRDVD